MTAGQWGQAAVVALIGAAVVAWLYRKVAREEEQLEKELVSAHRTHTDWLLDSEAARLLRGDDDERFEDGSGWRNMDEGDEEGTRVA